MSIQITYLWATLLIAGSTAWRYPARITLLRGNHESRQLTLDTGKLMCMVFMMSVKGNMEMPMHGDIVLMFFYYLTLSAIINGTVLCVHGGLSPNVWSVDQIRIIDRNCEIRHEGAFCDLMWSDPEEITWAVSPRGAGWLFGTCYGKWSRLKGPMRY